MRINPKKTSNIGCWPGHHSTWYLCVSAYTSASKVFLLSLFNSFDDWWNIWVDFSHLFKSLNENHISGIEIFYPEPFASFLKKITLFDWSIWNILRNNQTGICTGFIFVLSIPLSWGLILESKKNVVQSLTDDWVH